MKNLKIADGYASVLSLRETQRAIKRVKDVFQKELSLALNLERITAPLFVKSGEGINDDLNGIERCVSFDLKELDVTAEIVQSLAKWKRIAVGKYGFSAGEGIYTDMNAIRRDDSVDNIHSVFVDQWDWEKVIEAKDRNLNYLKATVEKIVCALKKTADTVQSEYPALNNTVTGDVFFITSQELEDAYPSLSAKERELRITKKHGTVFIIGIGGKLNSGIKHDGRAPDYDDWTLNGDLLVWNSVLNEQLELSSMGIRVDAAALKNQLAESGDLNRLAYPYHSAIINGALPLTMGGGIGQSRLCMFLLNKMHIGEVQVSLWDNETVDTLKRAGVTLL